MNDEDYHAVCTMLAMLGLLKGTTSYDDVAKHAFVVADKMLEELNERRNKEPEEGIVAIKKPRRTKGEVDG
jgi:predicted DNA binding protein